MSTMIIAEAGVNHNGDPGLAAALVEAAARAGADAIKFQTFRADRLVTARAPKAEYQARATGDEASQRDMLRRLELPVVVHEALLHQCASLGLQFLSTGFDEDSVDMLVRLGVSSLKVPSGEITNLPYLRHVGGRGLPVLLSTGMATLGDVEAAIGALEAAGTPRARITVLHCTTEYPTPMAEVNLRAMDTMRAAFGVEVGYSDHTLGIEVAIAAVARGARVIEKHMTLDRTMPGPDHAASLEPEELARMVTAIRHIDVALGDGVKRPSPGEVRNRIAARRSIVAAVPIQQGDILTERRLTTRRPGSGISPMRWDEILGTVARRDYAVDEEIDF